MDVERFKYEKFESFKAKNKHFWTAKVYFVAWIGLEMTADFGFGNIDVCLYKISSGLANIK